MNSTQVQLLYCVVIAITVMTTVHAKSQGTGTGSLGHLYSDGNELLNPAVTGSREAIFISTTYNRQWVSFPGAPQTTVFSFHAPMANRRIAAGLNFYMDKAGISSFSGLQASFAYRMPVRDGILSMGISAGMSGYRVGLASAASAVDNDPGLEADLNLFSSNAGFGVYYYSPQWYAGVAIPELFKANSEEVVSVADKRAGITVIAGWVGEFDQFQLKSELRTSLNPTADKIVSAGLTFGWQENLWFGGMYHSSGSIDGKMEYKLKDKMSIRYTYRYDFARISAPDPGTHMLSLGILIDTKKSPRREAGSLGYWF